MGNRRVGRSTFATAPGCHNGLTNAALGVWTHVRVSVVILTVRWPVREGQDQRGPFTHDHRRLQEIGREFGGRHHTTVLHSINKIDRMRRSGAALNRTITLRQRLALPPAHAGRAV